MARVEAQDQVGAYVCATRETQRTAFDHGREEAMNSAVHESSRWQKGLTHRRQHVSARGQCGASAGGSMRTQTRVWCVRTSAHAHKRTRGHA